MSRSHSDETPLEEGHAVLPSGETVPLADPRDQLLHDLFTTALEGGIGYWSQCESYHWSLKPHGSNDEVLANLDFKGFSATIVETDEESPLRHIITRAVILRGLRRLATGKATWGGRPLDPRKIAFYAGLDRTNGEGVDYDASDADEIVQAGLFGDIRYG